MKNRSVTRSVSVLACLGLLPAALLANSTADRVAVQKEGVELIRQLEGVARDVRSHAGQLSSQMNYTHLSKDGHLFNLGQIKELVNTGLAPALTRLTELQPHLPEWKQQGIEKLLATARQLAAGTNAALTAKNNAGTLAPAMNHEYKAAIAKVYDHAETLVKLADAAENYAAGQLQAAEAGLVMAR